jgi:dephospho-CoA kinase
MSLGHPSEDNRTAGVGGFDRRIVIMGFMGGGKTTASNHMHTEHGAKVWTSAERIKQTACALMDRPMAEDGVRYQLRPLVDIVFPDRRDLQDLAMARLADFRGGYTPEPGSKPRTLYQEVGEIVRRLQGDETAYCWEEELERRIAMYPARFTVIDVRAAESHHFFCDLRGYESWLVEADESVRCQRIRDRDGYYPTHEQLSHPSETDLQRLVFDQYIDNSGDDPQEFVERVTRVLIATS